MAALNVTVVVVGTLKGNIYKSNNLEMTDPFDPFDNERKTLQRYELASSM